MKYLIFANTPAHVHLYKYAARDLIEGGHEVEILAREYGCTTQLLDWYDLPYTVYGYCGTSKGSLLRRLPGHYARILGHALRYDPDLIFGMGGYASPAALVSRTPAVLILDSEPTSLDHAISRPLAETILTPDTFRKDLGEKHYTFPGFKETAYLHPATFSPDQGIRDALEVAPDEQFVILRFNAFGSHHDVAADGFSPDQRRDLVEELSRHATVFVSDEGGDLGVSSLPARQFDLHPALLHSALHEADLLVADTQTVVTEAALLGTPAIRSNSFVGEDDMGNFLALQEAGLIFNLDEFDNVLDRARALLLADDTGELWGQRRDRFLRDKVNLTELIVNLAETGGRPETIPELSTRTAVQDRSSLAARTGEPP